MDFLLQLKTLLWKNYIIRRKKPLRLIAELIWPLLIFSVLVVIRNRFNDSLITEMEECHFEDMSLPSSGLFSFLRSFYCNVDIPCYAEVKDGLQVQDYKSINQTAEDRIRHLLVSEGIFEITSELEKCFHIINDVDVKKLIARLLHSIENDKNLILQCSVPLVKVLNQSTLNLFPFLQNSSLVLEELYAFSSLFTRSKLSLDIYSKKFLSEICINKKILSISDDFRQMYCRLLEETALGIFKEIFATELTNLAMVCSDYLDIDALLRLSDLSDDMRKLFRIRIQLNRTLYFIQEINNLMDANNGNETKFSFQRAVCGPLSSRNSYTFLKLLNPLGTISPEAIKAIFSSKNNSEKFCFQILKNLKTKKQFSKGKILFTPVTNLTKKIIKLANQTFEDAEKLLTIMSDVSHLFPDIIEMLNNTILDEAKVLMTIYSIANFSQAYKSLEFISPDKLLPILTKLSEILDFVMNVSKCFDLDRFYGVTNEETLVKHAMENENKDRLLAGLVFSEDESSMEYKIRLDQSFVDLGFKYNIDGETKTGKLPTNPRIASRFLRSGFVFVQDLIEHAILKLGTKTDEVGSVIQMFPSPCYIEDVFKLVLIRTFPLFMTLAWLIMVPIIVKDIVYEKEKKLKEFMKIMGLSTSVHWVSWFVFYFGSMFISVLLLSLLLKFGKILQYANIFLVIIFLMTFLVGLISQCFMFSVFFNVSNAAASFSAVVYFASFLPFRLFVFHLDSMTLWHKLIASLSFTTAFGFGCNSLAVFESSREGIQWQSLFSHPTQNDEYSFAISMIMILFDSMLYLAIALYVEAVFPGMYGQAKPWYFPLLDLAHHLGIYKVNFKMKNKSFHNSMQFTNFGGNTYFNEANQENLPVGVLVQNLTKKYENNQPPAVNNLTVEFYVGQISGLLGHNGAGKTTTMFVITGILTSTHGTVFVKDLDVSKDIKKIRKIISFCPQHNILYDSLSVWQHLQFYSKLRGLSGEKLGSECHRILADINLIDRKDVDSQHLSGGMKRRLSVGIAYLGSPEVVILDEPTAGVDALARRFIWDLLLKYKFDRTTILSTHLMEEAEVLSDRLAIINKGRLFCSGSLMYLKNRFSSGYRLTAEIRKENFSESLRNRLVDLVKENVTGAELDSSLDIPYGSTFVLPLKSANQFPGLFKHLEDRRGSLFLSNYGVTSPSVEEIFVNINDMVDSTAAIRNNSATVKDDIENFKPSPKFRQITGTKLCLRQFTSLMLKRFYYFTRDKKSIFCQLILPPMFIFAFVFILRIAFDLNNKQDKALQLRPSIHTSRGSRQLNFFLARDGKIAWQPGDIERSLIEVLGLSDDCLNFFVRNTTANSCPDESIPNNISYSSRFRPNFTSYCSCSTGIQKCDSNVFGTLPKSAPLSNGDVVYNLTHFDIPDYLLKTRETFSEKRFGGYVFASNRAPSDDIVGVMASTLLLIGDVASGLNKTTSSDVNKTVRELKSLSPSLLKEKIVKVLFDYERPASMVTYLNSLHNAFLRSTNISVPHMDRSKAPFKVYDHPLNSTSGRNELAQSVLEILPPVCIMFAVTIVPTSFLLFLIEERQSGFMHLQTISGVQSTIYWLSNFIWDYISYVFVCLICVGIFCCFQMKEFVSTNNATAFTCLLFAYGWAVIFMTYPFAFVFNDGNTAYIFTSGGYFFCGLIPSIVMFVFDFIPDDEGFGDTLQYFFMLIPQFCLGRGLTEMTRNHLKYSSLIDISGGDSIIFESPFNFNVVGKFITALVFIALTAMVIFLVAMNYCANGCLTLNITLSKRKNVNSNNIAIDEDAIEEKRRIANDLDHDVLTVKNVTKTYHNFEGFCGGTRINALGDVTFGVRGGECFGLLGTNGAGKTTLFKILTGDLRPTSGDAFLDDVSIRRSKIKVRRHFGYCPQDDALCNLMTVREHIVLFSKLRGAPGGTVVSEICRWGLMNLNLKENENTLSKHLSGGNRRKLSIALSLIGSPLVVFMDEPTAGIDPRARRSVWNCIRGTIKAGQSVILTSHSLEECESLCNRVSIIVRGSIKCIGTVQNLKSKHTEGYTLSVKFVKSDVEEFDFEKILFRSVSKVVLKEQHDRFRTYMLLQVPLDLSEVFKILLDSKRKGEVEDFSINQTTLEQVFLKFASDDQKD